MWSSSKNLQASRVERTAVASSIGRKGLRKSGAAPTAASSAFESANPLRKRIFKCALPLRAAATTSAPLMPGIAKSTIRRSGLNSLRIAKAFSPFGVSRTHRAGREPTDSPFVDEAIYVGGVVSLLPGRASTASKAARASVLRRRRRGCLDRSLACRLNDVAALMTAGSDKLSTADPRRRSVRLCARALRDASTRWSRHRRARPSPKRASERLNTTCEITQ